MALRCATAARSMACCTLAEDSMAKPVVRMVITSLWSQKMPRPLEATRREATWNTPGSSSPAILNMLGIISIRPWEEV